MSKTKEHLMALILKKCAELKRDRNIDAFLSYSPHCNMLEIDVFKNWGNDNENKIYASSVSLDGGFNTSPSASSLYATLDDLNSIYLGLGVE